jgi:hypothetical protein
MLAKWNVYNQPPFKPETRETAMTRPAILLGALALLVALATQSKTASTGIRVSVTNHIIPSRAAIRHGVMALQGLLLIVAAGTG